MGQLSTRLPMFEGRYAQFTEMYVLKYPWFPIDSKK